LFFGLFDVVCVFIFTISLTHPLVLYHPVKRNKMSFIGVKAEEAAEKQIFEAGGYGALFKYRAVKTWKKVTSCCCA
jgi:hypothetical protein